MFTGLFLLSHCYISHPTGAHCNGIQPIKVAFGEELDALIPVLYWPDAVQRGARHGMNGNELLRLSGTWFTVLKGK